MSNNIKNKDFDKKKINLFNLDIKQMEIFFSTLGEKKYRSIQIMNWIYKKYCCNFDEMNNFSKNLKEKLKEKAIIKPLKIFSEEISIDGTIKWGILLRDKMIEMVYIPEINRSTLCISSQIGCVLKCTFCATGQMGFTRNLLVSEIISQIWIVMQKIHFLSKNNKILKKITNIVFMGMGEPLLNFKNILISLDIIINSYGFNFSRRKITISTSGIIPSLKKIIDLKLKIPLAISLHASNDKVRDMLMPINKKYNIKSLLEVVKKYLQNNKKKKRLITIEYAMLKNINDSEKDAINLSKILKNIPCKINLIPWNPFENSKYQCSSEKRILNFLDFLSNRGFITTIRKNRGKDINAACGQLSSKNQKNNFL